MWLSSRLACRDGATLLEPTGSKRPSAITAAELGIKSEHRAGLHDRAAYDRLFARYEATTLPGCRDALGRIAGWIDEGERVAITCYERDSRDCHRSRLVSAIVKTAVEPLSPRHL